MTTLGRRIKALRREMTIAEFCDQFAIHRNTLAFYEKDKTKPDSDFLLNLCNYFDVEANWLLQGTGARGEKNAKYSALNSEILIDAIDTLEQVLQATGKEMAPADKAEIIAKIYELYVEETQGTDKEKFSSILKLVANYD